MQTNAYKFYLILLFFKTNDMKLYRRADTHMLQRFCEERAEKPVQSEIKFFNESILEKLNRSKVMRTKNSIPFLTNTM